MLKNSFFICRPAKTPTWNNGFGDRYDKQFHHGPVFLFQRCKDTKKIRTFIILFLNIC